jgi:sulfide dehydrogenase [flavocytochrome c] flavoprotein chain
MLTKITRRQFGAGLALVAVAPLARPALALGGAKVVVIGGGAGGATVAGQLKRLSPDLDVTLVEPLLKYTSCFFSNAYIGGFYGLGDLTHGYRGLSALGVNIVHDRAASIDTAKRTVRLKTNKTLAYDRLVVAPGIDFKWDAIEGYSEEAAEVMPHAWRGRSQSVLLRKKLEAMEDGGTVVISVPGLPYRCPPGPYERACVIANYLAKEKPKSKVVIFDAKLTIAKQAAFLDAFERYYKDRIELHLTNDIDDFSVERVDPRDGEVRTRAGLNIKAAVANIIPPQTAGAIALQAGLADPDWCPVKPENFTSAKAENVYVLGDSSIANEMPKSAFSANSQGLVVAADIAADLEARPRESGRYRNTCWSIVAPGDAIKIGADYTAGTLPGNRPGLMPANAFVSKPGESAEERKAVYDEAFAWYPTLVSQIFNKEIRRPKGADVSGSSSR